MNEAVTAPGKRPTAGQLALAEALARGETRPAGGITTVPASVYTDPDHFAREKARAVRPPAASDRPSALSPSRAWRCRTTASACRCW